MNTTWLEDEDIINRTIVIDNVELGLMRIIQSNSSEYLLVPVWNFFGYIVYEYKENSDSSYVLDDENKVMFDGYRHSYLTINAIDGSIIDRSIGY